MDPLFSIENEEAYTEAQFDQMAEAAALAEAAGDALEKKHALSYAPSFAKYGRMMGDRAKDLAAAADAREADAASAAIRGIHDACRSCHSEHR
jgi:cytochrome c556